MRERLLDLFWILRNWKFLYDYKMLVPELKRWWRR